MDKRKIPKIMETNHYHTNPKTRKKNNFDPGNQRPIALTSCDCKTMGWMGSKRLIWYLESNSLTT